MQQKTETGSTYQHPQSGAWNRHQALLAVHYFRHVGAGVADVMLWCKNNIKPSIRPGKRDIQLALRQLHKCAFTRFEDVPEAKAPKPGTDYMLTDLGWQALTKPEMLNPIPTNK